jgi:hypothetical protein
MGGGATDQCLEGNPYPVQLYKKIKVLFVHYYKLSSYP